MAKAIEMCSKNCLMAQARPLNMTLDEVIRERGIKTPARRYRNSKFHHNNWPSAQQHYNDSFHKLTGNRGVQKQREQRGWKRVQAPFRTTNAVDQYDLSTVSLLDEYVGRRFRNDVMASCSKASAGWGNKNVGRKPRIPRKNPVPIAVKEEDDEPSDFFTNMDDLKNTALNKYIREFFTNNERPANTVYIRCKNKNKSRPDVSYQTSYPSNIPLKKAPVNKRKSAAPAPAKGTRTAKTVNKKNIRGSAAAWTRYRTTCPTPEPHGTLVVKTEPNLSSDESDDDSPSSTSTEEEEEDNGSNLFGDKSPARVEKSQGAPIADCDIKMEVEDLDDYIKTEVDMNSNRGLPLDDYIMDSADIKQEDSSDNESSQTTSKGQSFQIPYLGERIEKMQQSKRIAKPITDAEIFGLISAEKDELRRKIEQHRKKTRNKGRRVEEELSKDLSVLDIGKVNTNRPKAIPKRNKKSMH